MGVFAAGYLLVERNGWQELFPPQVLTNGGIARWLGANAHYNDVFVSAEVDIQKYPPQVMAISRKFVWKFDSEAALKSFVDALPAGAVLHLIRSGGAPGCAESVLGEKIGMVEEYAVVRVRAPLTDLAGCMFPERGPA